MGGGLSNRSGGTVILNNSIINQNQAIGGVGALGSDGTAALGGGIANLPGSTLTINNCAISANQAIGGSSGAGGNGGNGLGGGLFNGGLSVSGTPATLTVTGSTISSNAATGGAAGSGSSVGQGVGGGAYFTAGGSVCLDAATIASILGNSASTSYDDIFGGYTVC